MQTAGGVGRIFEATWGLYVNPLSHTNPFTKGVPYATDVQGQLAVGRRNFRHSP
jgi:hypothetical protein